MTRPHLRGVERVVFLLGALVVLGLQAWLLTRLPPTEHAAGATEPPPGSTAVGVPDPSHILWLNADDSGLMPARSEVHAGEPFALYVRNHASRPHSFRLRLQEGGGGVHEFAAIASGQQGGDSLTLAAGVYLLDGDGLARPALIESK